MTEYLLLLLVQITIFSSTTAVFLLAVRWIFRCRIPPKVGMAMWLILLLRVVCPVFPESQLSVYNLIPAGKEIMFTLTYEDWTAVSEVEETAEENPYVLIPDAGTDVQIQKQTISGQMPDIYQNRIDTGTVILTIYIAGVLLAGGMHFKLYRRAIRMLMANVSPCFDNRLEQLYRRTAEKLGVKRVPELYMGETSMTVGFLQPVIVIRRDENVSDSEYAMIFAHELNHYKHLDNQILLLSTVMCCVFWYNPLLWLVRKHLREDIELLCDVRTLRIYGIGAADYAQLLCRHSRFGEIRTAVGSPMSVSGKRLEKRLMTISLYKKHRFLSKTTSILLCAAIVAVCLTNPVISEEHAYRTYIENYARITGADERELYLKERITVHTFLEQINEILLYAGGESLTQKIGSGSLEKLKRTAAQSEYVDPDLVKELNTLRVSDILDIGSCAILLNCIADLLSENKTVDALLLLPEMLTVDTFETLCEKLTEQQAELLRSCYNRGVTGADVSFKYLYSNAMMDLIVERINDDWSKDKLMGFYNEISLSPEQLGRLSSRLNETIRYAGGGKEFYICDPNITPNEEKLLREILGAAVAGQREDVYYLKATEDGCSYKTAEELFLLTGFTVADMITEYASIGGTAYQFITSDIYTMISEYDVREYSNRLSDPNLQRAFSENFIYHSSYTYTGEDGTSLTVPFYYYTIDEENAEACLNIMDSMLDRLNAVAFPQLYKAGSLEVSGTLSETICDAAIQAVQRGFLEDENGRIYVNRVISGGQSAMIMCRFLAAMTNICP